MKTRSKSLANKNSKTRIDPNTGSNSSISSSAHIISDEDENQSVPMKTTTNPNDTQLIESTSGMNNSVQVSNQDSVSINVDSTKESNVWSFATKLPEERCQCNNCGKILSRKNFSTSGIRKHLSHCIGRWKGQGSIRPFFGPRNF